MNMVFITREIEFSASHRLYLEEYSDDKNYEVFGKCANLNGHGHNYKLQVTVSGVPDPKHHMVIHFVKLTSILNEAVTMPLDHKHLNHDVPFLKEVLPTSENIVISLWEVLTKAFLGQPFTLYRLKLYSTDRSWVEYFGPNLPATEKLS